MNSKCKLKIIITIVIKLQMIRHTYCIKQSKSINIKNKTNTNLIYNTK